MTLATFAALDAFADALAGVADLPELRRHDTALEGFTATDFAGVGFALAMEEGGVSEIVSEFGEPPSHELWQHAELDFAIEGVAGANRDTVLRAGVAALAGVMMPGGLGLRIDGKFENLRIDSIDRDLVQREAGKLPVDLITIRFALFITAPTPFG